MPSFISDNDICEGSIVADKGKIKDELAVRSDPRLFTLNKHNNVCITDNDMLPFEGIKS